MLSLRSYWGQLSDGHVMVINESTIGRNNDKLTFIGYFYKVFVGFYRYLP